MPRFQIPNVKVAQTSWQLQHENWQYSAAYASRLFYEHFNEINIAKLQATVLL